MTHRSRECMGLRWVPHTALGVVSSSGVPLFEILLLTPCNVSPKNKMSSYFTRKMSFFRHSGGITMKALHTVVNRREVQRTEERNVHLIEERTVWKGSPLEGKEISGLCQLLISGVVVLVGWLVTNFIKLISLRQGEKSSSCWESKVSFLLLENVRYSSSSFGVCNSQEL